MTIWYMDLFGSEERQVTGTCECGNEPSSSIKYGQLID